MKCKICTRQAEEKGLCYLHLRAYNNIMDKFIVWQKATNIEWINYLGQLQKNSLTGEWAKEVAKHLFREEEKDVEQNKENI